MRAGFRNSAWLAASRIADVATGRIVVDPGRAAEVRVELERLQRALHRLGLQLAGGVQALADAHGLVDLVRALPPRVGVGEDDQPERVRPAVDDGEPRLGHDQVFSISSIR